MKPHLNYFRRLGSCSWLTGCLICLLMAVTTTAVAEYKKPSKASSPSSDTTTSTATRGGCLNNSNTYLTAIAPYSHVGQTISTHPTFAWFIPDSEYFPLEFHLVEDTANSQLKTIYKQELSSSPGIMYLSLPQDRPGLTVGKRYRWQVVMRCTRYQAVVTMAEIEVVTPNSEFQAALSKTHSKARQAKLYAERGFWYDALEIALKTTEFPRTEFKNQLIQELAAVEMNSNSASVQQQGKKLAKIGDRLKNQELSLR